ncbi:MAG: DUF3108 domain-containing protein [Micavibrio aeruginosavorus]|nr:DUF3108 domain-containing protein [Micavibrio aeruginosavorus]
MPSAILAAALLAAAPAHAAGPTNKIQKMTYEVYAGGINAVSAELDVAYKAREKYNLALSAFTKGFLGALAPWKGTFETHGWINKDGMDQPELHRSTATWRDEEEVKEYTYDRKGHFTGYSVKDPDNAGKVEKPAPELAEGTIDILTATLHAMSEIGDGRTCAGTSEIFDGKRRFKMQFRFEDYEELSATRYNVYQGPSQRCVVEVSPVAGEWHSKPRGWMSIQEQGRQHGSLPTVWFAKLDPEGPAVPVKIRVKSDYGAMFMHLVNYNDGNSTVTAAIMKDDADEVANSPAPDGAQKPAAQAALRE